MTTLQIALTVIIPIFGIGIAAWVNITIKFANTPAEAIHGVKRIFFTILSWAFILYLILVIGWQLSLPGPITKISLIGILVPLFALSALFTLWLFGKYLEILRDSSEIEREHIAITKSIIAHAEDTKNI